MMYYCMSVYYSSIARPPSLLPATFRMTTPEGSFVAVYDHLLPSSSAAELPLAKISAVFEDRTILQWSIEHPQVGIMIPPSVIAFTYSIQVFVFAFMIDIIESLCPSAGWIGAVALHRIVLQGPPSGLSGAEPIVRNFRDNTRRRMKSCHHDSRV